MFNAVISSCQTMANCQGRQSCLHVQQWPMAKEGSHVFMLNNVQGRQSCPHVQQWSRDAVMSSYSTMANGGSHVFMLNNSQGRQSCLHVQQWPREAVLSPCSTMANGQGRQSCLHVQQWPMAKGDSHVSIKSRPRRTRDLSITSPAL